MMDIEYMVGRIDIVADAQRERLVGDPVKAFEYLEAEKGAVAYRDAGFVGDAPAVVQSWADARGWTTQQAAQDILTEAIMFHMALNIIRSIRLTAKYALLTPGLAEEQAQATYDQAIASLKAIG